MDTPIPTPLPLPRPLAPGAAAPLVPRPAAATNDDESGAPVDAATQRWITSLFLALA